MCHNMVYDYPFQNESVDEGRPEERRLVPAPDPFGGEEEGRRDVPPHEVPPLGEDLPPEVLPISRRVMNIYDCMLRRVPLPEELARELPPRPAWVIPSDIPILFESFKGPGRCVAIFGDRVGELWLLTYSIGFFCLWRSLLGVWEEASWENSPWFPAGIGSHPDVIRIESLEEVLRCFERGEVFSRDV